MLSTRCVHRVSATYCNERSGQKQQGDRRDGSHRKRLLACLHRYVLVRFDASVLQDIFELLWRIREY